MRTWTLVAAGLVAASVGTTAAVLPHGGPAAGQQEQKKKPQEQQEQREHQRKTPAASDDADRIARDVQRHIQVPGGPDVQIGVRIADLEGDAAQKMSGAVVSDVRDESPAAKAGVAEGDIVIEFDGERVRSARHLSRIVGETPAGRSVKMVVQREGRRVDLQITPEAGMARGDHEFFFRRMPNPGFEFHAPDFNFDGPPMRGFREHGFQEGDDSDVMIMPRGRGRLGIGIQDLTPQLEEFFGTDKGVLVTTVQPDSPAAKAGLKAGDVITGVGDAPISSPSDLTRAVRGAAEGSDLSIIYMRDKKSATATAKLERRERKKSEEQKSEEPI
jgi:membrane-associated protease RseP (regulator of RpoE activity)